MAGKILTMLFSIYNAILYRWNYDKPKVLIYSDSRAFNVINPFGKHPFDSYIRTLAQRYRVHFALCPQKYTTLVDFLDYIGEIDPLSFDQIILHCGIVDFSPRPLSNISAVRNTKTRSLAFQRLFEGNQEHYNNPSPLLYKNEKTSTLYSSAYLKNVIGPALAKIPNVTWIDSSPFAKGWDGNYSEGRPQQIAEVILKYENILLDFIKNRISLKDWSDHDVKRYTIDNIHFTPAGFRELTLRIDANLKETINHEKKN